MSKNNKILNANRIMEFNIRYPWTEKGPNKGGEKIRAFMSQWSYISEDADTLSLLDDLTETYAADLQDQTELNNLEIISPKSFKIILKNLNSTDFELKKVTEMDENTASLLAKSDCLFFQLGRVKFLPRKAIKNLSSFDIIINKYGLRLDRMV